MGRMNNKRTQAAAAAMNNTPSRARFSKGPPGRGGRGGKAKPKRDSTSTNNTSNGASGSNSNNNSNSNNKSNSSQNQRRGRQPNQETASRVIEKIQNRAQGPKAASTPQQSLQNVDKSKFDELILSEEIMRVITNLLTDLGVVDSSKSTNKSAIRSSSTSNSTTTSAIMSTPTPTSNSTSKKTVPNVETAALSTLSQPEEKCDDGDDDDDLSFDDIDIVSQWQQEQDDRDHEDDDHEDERQQQGTTGYEEYENDGEEEDYVDDLHRAAGGDYNNDWEGDAGMEEAAVASAADKQSSDVDEKNTADNNNANASNNQDKPDTFHDVQENPAFVHLTTRLSFSEAHAARACRAIEDWDIPEADNPNSKTDDKLSLAMDWICLHLTEVELTKGFQAKKQKDTRQQQQHFLVSKTGTPLPPTSGPIKAIPHPSISVAKSITSDKKWSQSVRQQERVVGFLKLGFHHSEATQACENDDLAVVTNATSPEQDVALLRLLQMLEQQVVQGHAVSGNATSATSAAAALMNKTDLAYAADLREQERQALKGIYEDQFQVGSSHGVERYSMSVTPAEDLQEPARTKDCKLLVFIRPGYPVVEPPLLLFTNPSLPPPLLRRINDKVARKAREYSGDIVVYEIVTFLAENLHETQMDFIKEQRFKEMEAQQRHLRLEAGHKVDAKEENDDKPCVDDGTLSRRQRTKLKAAEKSYVRPEDIKKQKEEQKRLKEGRLEQIKRDESNIRTSLAERTIAKRQEEQLQEEVERVARFAMNAAFNRGESVEKARAAAEEARTKCLRENGVKVPEAKPEVKKKNRTKEERLEEVAENVRTTNVSSSTQRATPKTAAVMDRLPAIAEPVQQNDVSEATPTTAAFMDRLRLMYEDAAKAKSAKAAGKDLNQEATSTTQKGNELEAYHLDEPKKHKPSNDAADELQTKRVPRPVAAPTKELTDVMNDVIAQQKQQPWLVFPEARAPTVAGNRETVTPERERQRKEISKKLRQELDRKRNAATSWALKNPNSDYRPNSKKKGFSPQHFNFMTTARQRLPAYKMEHEIVETIAANQITVIAGDTGCGKTTQVPQLVLDNLILRNQGALANIIITQPRRISAIGVSERIADERGEKVGETCGYSIKLEKKMSSRTRLLLCTTGILLRRLQCDPDLASVSHIFVDEVHERDLNTDFLIIILKDLLARRKNLKLVLMSATLNSDAFSAYFGGCPVVSIPGRAHPVQENRLEDILELTGYKVQERSDYALKTNASRPPRFSKSALRKLYHPKYSKETIQSLSVVDESKINYELLSELLAHISEKNEEGAILVFMPGMMEIQKAVEEMYKKEYFQSSKCLIYPLHSSLSTAEQIAIFEVPPEGVRKIVISTNIAETSITIEDVVYVVDAGRVKENRKDEINGTPTLVECWVSRASAKQRRGRAGRVRPGIAYHMYSSHTLEHDMQDYQLPEMLRVGIEDLVLQILILDLGEPTIFLSKALDPPSELAMSNSLKLLETLGAVECRWQQEATPLKRIDHEAQEAKQAASTCGDLGVTSELTALGFHLATLPVDPRVGKMMIYGSLFGCVDSALTVAASMSSRSPFVSPFDKRDQADAARKEFAAEGSDHLTILNAFSQWKDLKRQKGDRDVRSFLTDSFLSRLTLQQMEDLRKQFAGLLTEIGFLPKGFRLHEKNSPENSNASNVGLIKAVLCAGLYPNIIVGPRSLASKNQPAVPPKDSKKVGECAFQSHSKGEVYLHPSTISFSEKSLDSRYCCYHEMVKTSKTYVRDCTTVSPFALLLFGGALEVYQREGVCSVDKWLKFRIAPKPATLVKHLRSQMESILLKKIVAPEEDVTGTPEGKALLQSISALFEEETKARKVPDRSGGETVRPFAFDDNNYNNSGRGGRGRGGGENVRPFDDNNSNSGRGGRGRGGGENVRPFDNNNSNSGRGGRGRDGGRGSRGGGRGGRGRGRRGGGRDS